MSVTNYFFFVQCTIGRYVLDLVSIRCQFKSVHLLIVNQLLDPSFCSGIQFIVLSNNCLEVVYAFCYY